MCLLFIFFIIVEGFSFAPIINKPILTKFYAFFKEGNLRTSNFWNLTGTTIFIDDQDPNYNWSKTANDNDWCSGLGTKETPYLIENVSINALNFDRSITIVNSKAHFIIKNCSIINSEDVAGISLNNVTNGLIISNNCSNNRRGILLRDCHNNSLQENHLFNNNEDGIFLQNSNFTEILRNNISYSMQGIALEAICNNNTISLNKIAECDLMGIALDYGNNSYNLISDNEIKDIHMYSVGIFVGGKYNKLIRNSLENSGIALSGSSSLQELTTHTIDTTNLVNGKPIYYYANETHLGSNNFSNAGHILLVNCNNSELSNMDFTKVISGIMLHYCDNNLIQNISAKNNMAYGITLISSNNNTFLDNEVSYEGIGFYAFFSHNNTFQKNIVQHNLYGIRIVGCMNNTFLDNYVYNNSWEGFSIDSDSNGNTFYLNSFISNSINALDNSKFNKWDNGSIGNYWDDYIGNDLNDDNIGDLPYNITGTAGSKDYYPIFEIDPPIIKIPLMLNFQLIAYFLLILLGTQFLEVT
jgi:parallel beta-helix repeat protein